MDIQIIKSRRKTLSIQVKDSETVIVRAPNRCSKRDILKFIEKNQGWIDDKVEKARQQEEDAASIRRLTDLEMQELSDRAREVFKRKVEYYAPIVGVTYGRVTIRNQKTRWGSCSSKGNLNFNVALMRAPIEVLDYVVVHELCHRLYLNHSKDFWREVERVLPDYRECERWLKKNGSRLMAECDRA